MKLWLVLCIILAISIVSANGEFAVDIDSVNTPRASFVNGVLHTTNCDLPNKPQNLELTLDINYPKDCNGQFDLYVTYYDFATDTYFNEVKICTITGDKKCNFDFKITLGGKGNGTIELDRWGIFRGVCRYTKKEYEYIIPLKIEHTQLGDEVQAQTRIETAESNIAKLKGLLDSCSCCGSEMVDYPVVDIGYYNTMDETLRNRLKSCNITNLNSDAIQLNNEILSKIDVIKKVMLTCKSQDTTEKEEGTQQEQEVQEKEVSSEEVTDTSTKQGITQACPALGLILFLLISVGLVRSLYN
ncbi:MAG: hypothetical protein ACP5H8_01745 [Candidatus Micrarchaeia archaeon]